MSIDSDFITTVSSFSFVQTFFADPAAVGNSPHIVLTSVGLYLKNKANTVGNVSGLQKPGIVICICDVNGETPNLSRVHRSSFARLSFDQLSTTVPTNGILSPAAANKFTFPNPVKLPTGRTYGIVVILEDPSYELYSNRSGDTIIGTNTVSAGSPSLGSFIPKLFRGSNSGVLTPVNNTDLSIVVNVAKFNSNTAVVEFVNRDYEFFSINARTKNFVSGEKLFQQTANATGTISFTQGQSVVRGTGTTFTSIAANSYVVITANSEFNQVARVQSVSNNTLLTLTEPARFSNTAGAYKVTPTATVYSFDPLNSKLVTVDSTAANATFLFSASSTVVGERSAASANIVSIDNYTVDTFVPKLDADIPSLGRLTGTYVFAAANSTPGGYQYVADNARALSNDKINDITAYDGYLLSRSNEVVNSALYGANRKSGLIKINIDVLASNTNLFASPSLNVSEFDLFVGNNSISDQYTATDANSVVFDTEVGNAGIALARHISTKTQFANNRFAEDIRVFALAYRPQNTEVRVYAKIHNSADPDTFDDRTWTPLTVIGNADKFSSVGDVNDLVEYEYGFPLYPETAVTLGGFATTQNGNNQIAITTDPTTQLANNNLIKIYNPAVDENYQIAVVTAVNSSIITVSTPITNNNVLGAGLKIDRLKYYNTAFNNIQNDNICRYHNSSLAAFDKYDTMQIKIVLLSNNSYIVPKVEQVQVIGVSA